MWYSYWIPAKGYAMKKSGKKNDGENEEKEHKGPKKLSAGDKANLKGWIRQMSLDTTTAVVGTVIITVSFLVLGWTQLFIC